MADGTSERTRGDDSPMTSTGLRDRAEEILSGLEMLRIAVAEGDPKGQLLVRVGDLCAETRALLASPAPAGAEGEDARPPAPLAPRTIAALYRVAERLEEQAGWLRRDSARYAHRTEEAAAIRELVSAVTNLLDPATPPAEARELVEPPHWTDRYQGRPEGAYGWLDDEEVATKVRMLGRSDMDHEAVCTMARDRIAQLSRQVRDLLAALPGAATGKEKS